MSVSKQARKAMSKPLVYLDQNIIGQVANKELNLKPFDEFTFVYSKEHFSEIKRSTEPQKYLDALHKIDAKLLELEMGSDWKITGRATLRGDGTPTEHYSGYLEAITEVELSDNIFDPFLAWINGGGDEESLSSLPDEIAEQLFEISREFSPNDSLLQGKTEAMAPGFKGMINELIDNGNDINKTRSALGNNKGNIGNISGSNVIEQIWAVVKHNYNGMSCDQFFGFNPIDKQGYDNWPIYLGIVGCCSVMDILGFQAEKKCRKIDKIPNIRSDSGHIGMGAFCSLVISLDKRLVKRANAIYQYKGLTSSARVL